MDQVSVNFSVPTGLLDGHTATELAVSVQDFLSRNIITDGVVSSHHPGTW